MLQETSPNPTTSFWHWINNLSFLVEFCFPMNLNLQLAIRWVHSGQQQMMSTKSFEFELTHKNLSLCFVCTPGVLITTSLRRLNYAFQTWFRWILSRTKIAYTTYTIIILCDIIILVLFCHLYLTAWEWKWLCSFEN